MKRGSVLWVQEPDGSWERSTYEFRCVDQEPLGHHSVMLDNGGGRRVVCGCKTSEVELPNTRQDLADYELIRDEDYVQGRLAIIKLAASRRKKQESSP